MIGAIVARRKIPAAFEALNRRDIDSFLKDWSADATFIYPGQIAPSGEHVGRAAVRGWFENLLAQFPELRFTVTAVSASRLFDMTGTNTIIAEWEIEVTNHDGYAAHNTGTTSVELRRGKAVHAKDYIFDTGEVWLKAWGALTEQGPSAGTPQP
jgi:ketosteroid isomerase-like protein